MRCEKCHACRSFTELSEPCNFCGHIDGTKFKRNKKEQIDFVIACFDQACRPAIEKNVDADYIEGFLIVAIRDTIENERKEQK